MTVIANISTYWGEYKGPINYLEFFENNLNERLNPVQFAKFTLEKITQNNPFIRGNDNLLLSDHQLIILESIILNPSPDEYEDFRLICFNLSSEQLDFVGW